MDDSGENPFADPKAVSGRGGGYGANGTTNNNVNVNAGLNTNLFDDYDPFGDVGAQPVAQAPATQPDPLEGYNPFEKPPQPASQPAVLATEPSPVYTPSPALQVNTDHYLQQQRELDRKAAELESRERELRMRDEELRQQQQKQQQQAANGATGTGNNWPPLPKWIPIKPCFYQDVEVEIPHAFQHVVKQMYYIWLAHFCLLLLNFVGGLSLLFWDVDGIDFILSLLWLVLFTPCSFVCWFRPVYKAFRSDSSLNFMIFFFVFCAQSGMSIVMALGIGGSGMCGIFYGLKILKTNLAIAIINLVIGLLFGLLAAAEIVMLIRIHRLYRSRDGVSMAEARKEAVSGLMSNKNVRDTVVDVGAAAATAAATGN